MVASGGGANWGSGRWLAAAAAAILVARDTFFEIQSQQG